MRWRGLGRYGGGMEETMDASGNGVEVLCEGRHLRFVRRKGWEWVSRRRAIGIVGMAGRTAEGKLVLVSQWREPVGRVVVEWPAGLAGDEAGSEGESLESAARRELLEETGYVADVLRRVAEGPPSAGATDEVITFFVAEGLRKAGEGGGVGGEKIRVHEVPEGELSAWCRAREAEGWLVDPKVFAGAYWLKECGR